jgi:hypothetical protein
MVTDRGDVDDMEAPSEVSMWQSSVAAGWETGNKDLEGLHMRQSERWRTQHRLGV